MLIRRLLILIVYVSEYTNVERRTYGIGILCFGTVILHTLAWPYLSRDDNVLDTLALSVLTYAAITQSSFSGGWKLW